MGFNGKGWGFRVQGFGWGSEFRDHGLTFTVKQDREVSHIRVPVLGSHHAFYGTLGSTVRSAILGNYRLELAT